MYCTVKDIIREVLDTDVPDSECVFAVVLTRGDVRHIAQDWNLSDDELETVMQRLDDAFEHGADVSVVHDVVRELMEEKRVNRLVTVPAVLLEKVMVMAGSEIYRLHAVGSENGGDGDAFVRGPPRPLISPVPRKSRCIRGEIRCDATTAHRASGKAGSVLHPRCRGTATTGG